MDLLAKPTRPTPPPRQPLPTEVLVRRDVSKLTSAPRRIVDEIMRIWKPEFDRIWNNEEGLTPAQVLVGLGPIAGELFQRNTVLAQFVIGNLTKPDGTYQDPELVAEIMGMVNSIPPYTINQDGTVTLN